MKITSSVDFINSIEFDYIEIYSFQRGEEYEALLRKEQEEYNQLFNKKRKGDDWTNKEEERWEVLGKRLGFTQYFWDGDGGMHPTAKLRGSYSKDHKVVSKLLQILRTEVRELPLECEPVYRDAVVFYNTASEKIAVLNICLGCDYMEIDVGHYINADMRTYDLLRYFFRRNGYLSKFGSD